MTQPAPPSPSKLTPQQRLAGAAVATTLIIGLIPGWEGERPRVYLDGGRVPTVCDGHTGKDVQLGQDPRTHLQCMALLAQDMHVHALAVSRCITSDDTPPTVEASAQSLDFNGGKFCGSTMNAKINQRDYAGACRELSRWVYDKQDKRYWPNPVPGLVRRRAEERAFCEGGLK